MFTNNSRRKSFLAKIWQKVWWNEKKFVPLHPQTKGMQSDMVP